MESFGRLVSVLWVIALGACVLGLQRPPPRYSQQYMPETSFTCRNKIVGSYYADPETDCQVFHVCVSVAGTVQDYKFLCPNDTAFDQESQTCADWYDVDCEAATLYYASDNFDLYRIGSGLESLHYDSIRSDAEPQDHLQRSESSDPVRSSANTLNRVSSSNSYSGSKDLRGSSSGNFYNNRNGKDEDYETEKTYKEEFVQEKKKSGVRKSSRKQQFNYSSNDYNAPVSSTSAPAAPAANQNTYTGFYSGNNYNQRNGFVSSTSTARPQENFNRNPNGNRYNTPSSTYRPSTNYQNNYNNYQSVSTTSKTTVYNAYNNGNNYNQQNNGFSQSSSTLKPTTYKSYNQNYNNNNGQFVQSTTLQPSTNYQPNDYTNFQRNYNNIQRGSVPYQSTTASSIVYDDNYNSNNKYRTTGGTTRQDISQATTKYYPSFASSSYAPTTYSPPTKKYVGNDNTQAQTGQYYEKSSQPVKSSSQYYDSTKAPKKATQFNNYDSKYYTESSTGNYDLARSSVGIGFSPASINHLAESPRSTTPVPRKISTATTYNPNTFYSNSQRQQSPTTPKASTYVSGSARPFSSTTRLPTTTSPKPKSGKKNDYDYAYYDNIAGLEYDSLDLEHVTGNKESTKIARN
ncbi:GATA zinc finger domain-containing protein 14-like [Ceratina calcarata]|uniref:GATA zinc finger domain-containing protein 14-like n=1 Tax=Ceratina calcarata TaxID=156304 RepID=A0AAJ7JGN1_9HYME|nr:GATA zinc finger domain-containing protein 14-like [Ceratina calcarata]